MEVIKIFLAVAVLANVVHAQSKQGLTVQGFTDDYAAGNGNYKYIGEADGFPSYARDSDVHAPNWRVYHTSDSWIIGNSDGFATRSTGGFASVQSSESHPYNVRGIWSNSRVSVLERGHGPLVNDITVLGFTGSYAPGNGKYCYIGDSNGAPAWAHKSSVSATNWRIFRAGGENWLITNADVLKTNSVSYFATARSIGDRPPQSGWSTNGVITSAPDVLVRGFLNEYSPGNGGYSYIGQKNGYPSYKRASTVDAPNWRIYWTDGAWIIGNDESYQSNSQGGFASVSSTAASPQSVTSLWSNTRINVLEDGDPPLVEDINVSGFTNEYAPGNGVYYFIGVFDGRPAYAHDADTATNWRVYHSGNWWFVGNDQFGQGGFAYTESNADRPPNGGYSYDGVHIEELPALKKRSVASSATLGAAIATFGFSVVFIFAMLKKRRSYVKLNATNEC